MRPVRREIVICGEVAILQLTQGHRTMFDAKLAHIVSKSNWTSRKKRNHYYATGRVDGKSTEMHRVLFYLVNGKPGKGFVIDHVNGDSLDNRLENLRAVSYSINAANSVRKGNLMRGISRDRTGKWRVRFCRNGVRHEKGGFESPESAIVHRDQLFQFVFPELELRGTHK